MIVGLGNPGDRYEDTPHSLGFEVVGELAKRLDCRMRRSFRLNARVGRAAWKGTELLLLQPLTYMNNSGFAVAAALRYYRLEPSALLVIVDDADLEVGSLRIRRSGSSGGHKGLISISQSVGSEDFGRLRLGIGR